MARASALFGNAFAWGGNGRPPAPRTKRRAATGPASPAPRVGPSVRVEPLEGRTLMAVTLVSANVGGLAGGAGVHSRDPEISADGRFVVYTTAQADVVGGVTDTNEDTDVYVRDLATNTSTLVSGRADNIAFGGFQPTISADGRYVAFVTDEKLVDADNAPGDDVYVWDRQSPGTFTLASARTSDGGAVTGIQPSISNDGRVVAFVTDRPADTIAAGATDANTARDVFVRNLDTNTTVLASATPGGTAAGNAESTNPQISGDGTAVVFLSDATDLVAGVVVPGTGDAYRRVLAATQADLVSVTAEATPAGGGATGVSVSDNGNLVAFSSGSVNIVAGDINGVVDVFVRDMTAAQTTVVSATPGGERNNSNASAPSISGDGNFVAFASSSSNLVEPDPGTADIFVKSLVDGSIRRVSWTDPGNTQPNFGASFPSIDADGNAVAFVSQASDLVPNTEPVAEQDEDVFAWTAGEITPPEDVPPTAAVTTTDVTTVGGTSHTVQVIYADNVAVDVSSIGVDDIAVTGPGAGGAALTVAAVQVTPTTNATTVTATYQIDAPGGTWDAADDGAYTVTLAPGAVRDTAGNTTAAQTATFTVGTETPPPPPGDGPDLVAAVVPARRGLPASVVGGARGNVRVQLTNNGNEALDGTTAVALLARGADAATQGTGDVTLVTTPERRIRLRPGQSRIIPLRFTYPSGAPDGAYNLVAVADPGNTIVEGSDTNNEGVAPTPVTVAAPFVDVSAVEVGAPGRGTITAGRRTPVPVVVENLGNTAGTGTLRIDVYASTSSNTTIVTGEDVLVGTITRPLRLRNGQRRVFRVTLPGDVALPAGQYFLTAVLVPEGLTDANPDNNTAVSGSQFPAA